MAEWKIFVNGISRSYISMKFDRKLVQNSPSEFSAKVKYADDIGFFNVVEIKRDNVTEWKGFAENIKTEWNENERYLNIAGRDISLLLWRKFNENFTDMAEDTKGFFGVVNPNELIKFLLGCPCSDFPVDGYPNNKQGWGIDASRIISLEANKTAYGDINWTILRKRGLGWYNSGDPYKGGILLSNTNYVGEGVPAWECRGIYPQLRYNDDDNYIHSDSIGAEAYAGFEHMTGDVTAITGVKACIWWKPHQDWVLFPDHSKVDLYAWIASTSSWSYLGQWEGEENPLNPNPWRYIEWDINITSISDLNALQLKFVNLASRQIYITQAYIAFSYAGSGSQTIGDYVTISLEGYEEIMGIYIESRIDNNSYPRNYTITGGGVTLASVSNNIYRDIIHSWTPTSMKSITITITGNSDMPWHISQIYIYKAESLKYRILNGDVSPPPPYVGGPYVKVVSIDSPYPLPIGPLNIAQNRLYDTLGDLCDILNTDYVPYEWYIAYDDDNTFHLTTRRGSDKSDSIIFEKGVNLRGTSFESSTEYTTQRVKVVGRGEGKRQDDVSSAWVNDESAMDTVGGFIEDVVTKKSVANEEIADTLARVHLKMNALPKNTIQVDVSKDTYDSMEYDVGDDAKIIDALTELNESKRIFNIKKDIDSGGEHIKLYVDYPYKDVEEVWGDIYKKLKDLSLVGTIAADWSGQGTKEGNVGADQLSPLFDITAKNDEVTVGNDKADPKWAKDEHGGDWQANNDNMVIYGPEFGYGFIRVECRYKVVKNVPRGGTIEDVSDAIDIPVYKTPKFVCEFKIDEPSGINYTSWREGDDVDFGMFNMDTKLGFLFKVIKTSGFFTVYAVSYTEKGQIVRKITTIKENVKYRAEIITDGDNNSVTLNLWDIEQNPDAKYPVSAVFLSVNQSMTVRPLYAAAYADGDLEISLRCVMFLYEMKCEYNRAG